MAKYKMTYAQIAAMDECHPLIAQCKKVFKENTFQKSN